MTLGLLWDWATSAVGLRPVEGLFVPAYWRLAADLTAAGGWVPWPGAVLGALVALSLAGVGLFLWTRRSGWMNVAFVVWGALLADTPYIAAVPLVVWIGWAVASSLILRFRQRDMVSVRALPWGRLCAVGFMAFLTVALHNFWRMGGDYVPGYVRHAIRVVRWDGGWHPGTQRAMDGLLADYVSELVREAGGRPWIFTDGVCDAGIEWAAYRARAYRTDRSLLAIPLEGWKGEAWLRDRLPKAEDRAALSDGGTKALFRTWMVDRPEALSNCVFQCGFSFLEQGLDGRVAQNGLVLQAGEVDVVEQARAADATLRLGQRIVDFYAGHRPAQGGRGRLVPFCVMQWRVARALRLRAVALDRQARASEALSVSALSEKLDQLNPLAFRRTPAEELASGRPFGTMTPREGLSFALRRADFVSARRYAEAVLEDEPAHAEANFALAMHFFSLREYAKARQCLRTALESRPDDAALLNNLAVASFELGDLQEAREQARAALRLKPDSAAIRDTLRNIEQKLGVAP